MRTHMHHLTVALVAALIAWSGPAHLPATEYEARDLLPLAVGNSWIVGHSVLDFRYLDEGGVNPEWLAWEDSLGVFTLRVERTEEIDGRTYYVLSDMPSQGWPPAPPDFIAGRKLRWIGAQLMEGPRHHWSGRVTVGGDLTVADTLAVAVGSVVRFAVGDATSSGQDPARAELTVQGSGWLVASRITFEGVAGAPAVWYGIHVEADGTADLSMARVRDAVHCVGGAGAVTQVGVRLLNCGLPPEAPGNRTAAPGDQQLTLTWDTPEDNGSALTRYQYRHSTDGGRTWAPNWRIMPGSTVTTTSHVFGGLANGEPCTFEVRARNRAGKDRRWVRVAGGPDN